MDFEGKNKASNYEFRCNFKHLQNLQHFGINNYNLLQGSRPLKIQIKAQT